MMLIGPDVLSRAHSAVLCKRLQEVLLPCGAIFLDRPLLSEAIQLIVNTPCAAMDLTAHAHAYAFLWQLWHTFLFAI